MKNKDNIVYVGSKKPSNIYVFAVMTQFNNGNDTVIIKGRGSAISKVVDVAEIVKNRFFKDSKATVKIGTERMKSEKLNEEINVSTIEITLTK